MSELRTREEEAEALLGAMIAAQRRFGRLGKVPLSVVGGFIESLHPTRPVDEPDVERLVRRIAALEEAIKYGDDAARMAALAAQPESAGLDVWTLAGAIHNVFPQLFANAQNPEGLVGAAHLVAAEYARLTDEKP